MKKFISFILSIFLLPSYLFSFLPAKIHTDFTVDANVIGNTAEIGGKSVDFIK